METRTISKQSFFTGSVNTMTITLPEAEWATFDTGLELIQHALPSATPDEREFLMTGATPEEWASMFPEDAETEHDDIEEVAHCRSAFSADVPKGWESTDLDDIPF